MDMSVISEKREDLKRAMVELCKSAESDQKLCDAIKERGFWERVFSNNTRDLAKAGMAQQELFDKLQHAVQGLMEVVQDGHERERQFIGMLDDIRLSGDHAISVLRNAIGRSIRTLVKHGERFKTVEEHVGNNTKRIASSEAADRVRRRIVDTVNSAQGITGIEFQQIVRDALNSSYADGKNNLRAFDKKYILDGIRELKLANLKLDVGAGIETMSACDICEHEFALVVNDVERYSAFRDELIHIIDDFTSEGANVDPEGVQVGRLAEVRKRLLENEFEIALIGEFQGGKSTTFNAICGGREISPRGLSGGGVKTSAAVVTAQNISDGQTKNGMAEWAEISWMDESEVLARIRDAVIVKRENKSYSIKELHDAIAQRWQELVSGKFDADTKDRLNIKDSLQVASLQLKVLESTEYKKYQKQKVVGIDEFQRFVKFPERWDSRWIECADAVNDFSVEECLFSCVSSVLVRIHSPFLAKMGCKITDCPGLFVNSWDTHRAMEVMMRSNAIWILLDGQKTLSEDQLNVLSLIRGQSKCDDESLQEFQGGISWVRKCFFTLNVKKSDDATSSILAANIAKIQSVGFNVENINRYHALISMRLQQLRSLQLGGMSKYDLECLALESRQQKYAKNESGEYKLVTESIADAQKRIGKASTEELRSVVRSHLQNIVNAIGLKVIADAALNVDDNEVMTMLEPIGNMNVIVAKLASYVSNEKAVSILIDKGAKECKRILDTLEDFRKTIERDLTMKSSDAAIQWNQANDRLKAFTARAYDQFIFINDDDKGKDIDKLFLADFYAKEEAAICREAEIKLISLTKEEWEKFHLTSNAVEEAISPKMSEAFSTIFNSHLQQYVDTVNGEQPNNRIYSEKISKPVQQKWSTLLNEWAELSKKCPNLSSIKLDSEIVKELTISPWSIKFRQQFDLPVMFAEVLRNAFDWVGSKLFGWLGFKREDSSTRIERELKKLDVVKCGMENVKDSVSNNVQFMALFAQIRKDTFAEIVKALNNAKEQLSIMESAADARRKSSENKLNEAIEESRKIRENIITPKKQMVDDYVNRVQAIYA